jgi:GAF domain-containing protein
MAATSEQLKLLEKLRHLEEREAFHRRTLADILAFSTRLTKTTDLSTLYRQSNLLALNILGLDYSTLMILSEDGNSLVIRDAIGFPAAMIGTFTLVEGQGLSTYVVKEKKAALVEDFQNEKRFEIPPVVFREGIVSAISVPMLLGGQVFGVMIGHTRSRRRFTSEEIDLYQSLANQAAVAIKNVIHFESLRESERRFRTLIDNAADAIFLADTDGRLVDVNEQACLSLGYSRDELLAIRLPSPPGTGARTVPYFRWKSG